MAMKLNYKSTNEVAVDYMLYKLIQGLNGFDYGLVKQIRNAFMNGINPYRLRVKQ